MNFYDVFMYPLEKRFLQSMRKSLIPQAKGEVLEIGAGTGANFKFYDNNKVRTITVLDKEVKKEVVERAPKNTVFVSNCASTLPFDDESFDTVVETLLLCSVDDVDVVLKEIARVLKPDGVFLHIDHGLPKSKSLRKLFNAFAPVWHSLTKSCQINKEFEPKFKSANFETDSQVSKGSGVFCGGVSKRISNKK